MLPTLTTTDWYDMLERLSLAGEPVQLGVRVHDRRFQSRPTSPTPRCSFIPTRSIPSIVTSPRPVARISPFPARHARGRAGRPLHVQRHDLELGQGRPHQLLPRATTPRATRPTRRCCSTTRSTTTRYDIQTIAPQFDGKNASPIVNLLAMNNIFDGSTQRRRQHARASRRFSQLQYNLFYQQHRQPVRSPRPMATSSGNVGAVYANPEFVGPVGTGDASAQNFELEPDLAGDQLGLEAKSDPTAAGNAIYPTVDLDAQRRRRSPRPAPTRNADRPRTARTDLGRIVIEFGFGSRTIITDPRQIRHIAGIGLLQLPRRVGARAHHQPQRLFEPQQRHRHVQLRTSHRPARHSGLHSRPASRYAAGHRLRQQSVHRHRCLSVRQSAPARGHRVTETPTQGADTRQLLHGGRHSRE